jgi:ribose transport system permease protein
MSVGMTFVLIIAGIDLSVGSVLALGASVVSVAALKWGWGVLPSALLGMAAAALTGTVTGAVTVGWRIPSFIVSLGVLEAARGLAYQMTNSRTAYIGDAFDFLSNPIAFGISPAFIIAVAGDGDRAAGAHAHGVRPLSDRHRHQRGSGAARGRQSAALQGHRVRADGRAGRGWPRCSRFRVWKRPIRMPGFGLELQVIAAVVIGGTSLMGGRGSVISTFFGVLIISVLAAGLAQIGANRADQAHHHRRGDWWRWCWIRIAAAASAPDRWPAPQAGRVTQPGRLRRIGKA